MVLQEILRIAQSNDSIALKFSLIFTNISIVVIIAVIVLYAALSPFIADIAFIVNTPLLFLSEAIVMFVGGMLPYLFLSWTRLGSVTMPGFIGAILSAAQFLMIHVVLQTSGNYTYFYGV